MKKSVEELIFYGDDVKMGRFPEETRFYYSNPPLPAAEDPLEMIRDALDHPIGAETLESRLNSGSRVLIAFDDPCLPIPLMQNDIRGMVIDELLTRLSGIGVPEENIRLICANGLHRKWTIDELAHILGKSVIDRIGADQISCHDATDAKSLVSLGTTGSEMSVEINRAVVESDITLYVNINFTSMNGGWKSILVGLGSWNSIRCHHTPRHWNGIDSLMDPATSPMHLAFSEMGQMVKERCNVFQIETVINNAIWPPLLAPMLSPLGTRVTSAATRNMMRSLFSVVSASPRRIKRSIRNIIRADYKLFAIHAGDVDRVHELTLDRVNTQQNVRIDEPADIVIYGVPNLSPYSAFSVFNPILLRSVVLGYMRGLYTGQPLVRAGGVIIASNPGIEKFHHRHHPSYVDFWKKDLADFSDPETCWSQLVDVYAENPEYLEKYREQHAYHGTHCLINWFWSGMAMRQVQAVILAGARQPETARKIGFVPAPDMETAICMAREMKGPDATIGYPVMPPLFGAAVEPPAPSSSKQLPG